MSLIEAVKSVLYNYLNFSGRARRSEYWYWTLAIFLFSIAMAYLWTGSRRIFGCYPSMTQIYTIAISFLSLSVTIRRLHDIGKSGWWYVLYFIPFVGPIILFILLCQDSELGLNQWGNNPKGNQCDEYNRDYK